MRTKRTRRAEITLIALVTLAASFAVPTASPAAAYSESFAGYKHLNDSGAISDKLSIGTLQKCSEPKVSFAFADLDYNVEGDYFYDDVYSDVYQSTCYIRSHSVQKKAIGKMNLMRALRIYTFATPEAKVRYFGSNSIQRVDRSGKPTSTSLDRHPCLLRGSQLPIIDSSIYIIHPVSQLKNKESRITAIHKKLNKILIDEDAVIVKSDKCSRHLASIRHEYARLPASRSFPVFKGWGAYEDEAIGNRCAPLQRALDSIDSDSPTKPTNGQTATCLGLRGKTRRDFIKALKIRGNNTRQASYSDTAGFYLPGFGPLVLWEHSDFRGLKSAVAFASTAMHEYLHKFYFENMDFLERTEVDQQILKLIHTDDRTSFLHYTGLGLPQVSRAISGHHLVDVGDLEQTRDLLSLLGENLFNREQMTAKLVDALPQSMRKNLRYRKLVSDNYGLLALINGLVNDDKLRLELSYIVLRHYKHPANAKENSYWQRLVVNYSGSETGLLETDHYPDDIYDKSTRSTWSKIARLTGLKHPSSGSGVQSFTPPKFVDDYTNRFAILYDVLFFNDNVVVEGYPIVALNLSEDLPDWFEEHYSRFFGKARLKFAKEL